eukprot:gene32679-39509_t
MTSMGRTPARKRANWETRFRGPATSFLANITICFAKSSNVGAVCSATRVFSDRAINMRGCLERVIAIDLAQHPVSEHQGYIITTLSKHPRTFMARSLKTRVAEQTAPTFEDLAKQMVIFAKKAGPLNRVLFPLLASIRHGMCSSLETGW